MIFQTKRRDFIQILNLSPFLPSKVTARDVQVSYCSPANYSPNNPSCVYPFQFPFDFFFNFIFVFAVASGHKS